jgi:hypothetical protein
MSISKVSIDADRTFWEYLHSKYKGKVYKMERLRRPEFMGLEVHVMFRMPEDGADEIEMYRRINKVIHVIAEGED